MTVAPSSSALHALFDGREVATVVRPIIGEPPLLPSEALCVAGVAGKRRREFATGRACARAALSRLGIERHALLVGRDSAPLWPEGIVGSISHEGGLSWAAVARRGAIASVGIDLETREVPEEVWPVFLTGGELGSLLRERVGRRRALARVLFSAKESVYKCLQPLARRFLDFHEVEIDLDERGGRFRAKVPRALVAAVPADCRPIGRFLVHDRSVWTSTLLAGD